MPPKRQAKKTTAPSAVEEFLLASTSIAFSSGTSTSAAVSTSAPPPPTSSLPVAAAAHVPKKETTSNFARQIQSEGRAHAFLASDGGHRLIERVRRQLAISHDAAYIAVYNYLIFLLLKEEAEDWNADKLSPTGAIDEIWHLHILDTAHYGEDVRKLCPSLVEKDKTFHHNPDGVFDEDGVRKRRQETTSEMMENRMKRGRMYWSFGQTYGRTSDGQGGEGREGAASTATAVPATTAAKTQIKVHVQPKANDETWREFSFSITPATLGETVMRAIQTHVGIRTEMMILYHQGIRLDDRRTLMSYGLKNESEIYILLHQYGC